MKRQIALLLAVFSVVVPGSAFGDSLSSTLGEPISEVSHAVSLTLEDGIARYRVRRTFRNTGATHDEAFLNINLPFGAAATGLRIRVGEKWYDGELMEAGRAAELYQELTGIGPHTPRDPALLSWEWADRLNLQIFPVPPGGTATVEYTLTVPTDYRDGRYLLTYPLAGDDPKLGSPVLTVKGWKGAVMVGQDPITTGQPVILHPQAPDSRCAALELPEHCAASAIAMEHATTGSVALNLSVRHTYRSDLRVVLVAPSGQRFEVFDNEGGSENDLQLQKGLSAEPAPAGIWRLGVVDDANLDVGVISSWTLTFPNHGARFPTNLPLAVPDQGSDGAVATITLRAPLTRVAGRVGRVSLKGASASRLELDVPEELSQMPVEPHVVFLIDTSISVGEQGLAEQRKLVEAFLRHVPDARVEIVAFSRYAKRLSGSFVGVEAIAPLWERVQQAGDLELANGSNADLALAEAYAALPDAGSRYVVAFTDDRLRPSWPARLNLPRFQPEGLATHMLVLDGAGSTLTRDDDHHLADIALRGGGILSLVPDVDAMDAKQLVADSLHLVRPTRLELVTVNGFEDVPDVLVEGAAVREMFMQRAPKQVQLKAKLWAKSYTVGLRTNRSFDRATAAWVFSHDLHDELDEKQMMAFAMFGRAVTPVTSYLAIEPGVRPSPIGIDRSSGSLGGRGMGRGRGGVSLSSLSSLSIKRLLEPAAKWCHQQHGGSAARLALHSTVRELVDVELRSAKTPYATCLVEAAWALSLPSVYANYAARSEELLL